MLIKFIRLPIKMVSTVIELKSEMCNELNVFFCKCKSGNK